MINKLPIFFLIIFSFHLSAKAPEELKPSKATLSMEQGDMEVWLERKEGDTWEMGSKVDGGRIFNREESSVFKLKNDSLIPIEHRIKMKILFKKIRASARFNWQDNKLDFKEGKSRGSIKLEEGTLGPATAQLKMRLDLRSMDINNLPDEIIYKVYFRGEIKERTYLLKGFEKTKTPLGVFDTLRVERQFLPEEEREQIYWFAPDLDFSIVRIVNNDGRKSDILLKSIEFGD